MRNKKKDVVLASLIWASAFITVAVLIGILGYILINGIPHMSLSFLTSTYSAAKNGSKGILPMIINTLYIIVLSLLLATPVGIGSAIYLTQYAKQGRLVRMVRFATEVLSGALREESISPASRSIARALGWSSERMIHTAGFGPQDPATGQISDDVAEQTRQVLRNIAAVLAERGVGLDDVLKTTVHLADLADFAAFNEAYQEFFTQPYPVRTTVGSQLAGILVEIDVVARIPA